MDSNSLTRVFLCWVEVSEAGKTTELLWSQGRGESTTEKLSVIPEKSKATKYRLRKKMRLNGKGESAYSFLLFSSYF